MEKRACLNVISIVTKLLTEYSMRARINTNISEQVKSGYTHKLRAKIIGQVVTYVVSLSRKSFSQHGGY